MFASLAILPTVLALTSPTSLATLLAFGSATSASTMRARVSDESRFLFPVPAAASRMSAFLAIALTVDGWTPAIPLATALAFGFVLSASAIFSRVSGESFVRLGLIPSWRAARTDPVEALRHE